MKKMNSKKTDGCKNTMRRKKQISIKYSVILALAAILSTGLSQPSSAQTVVEPLPGAQTAVNASATASTAKEDEVYHSYSCGRPACANHHHDSESAKQKAIIFRNQQLNHNFFTVIGGAVFLWLAVGALSMMGKSHHKHS